VKIRDNPCKSVAKKIQNETKKKEFLDGALAGAAVLPGLPSSSWICTGSPTIKSIWPLQKK
jgi:hypothetical protein